MGEVRVPADAALGRADPAGRRELPDLGPPMPPALIHALGLIKAEAAARQQGRGSRSSTRPRRSPTAITTTSSPIDVFQTGSGTSSNMNANEVIARARGRRRASQRRRQPCRSRRTTCSPRRYISRPRSRSRDSSSRRRSISPRRCARKQREFAHVVKSGRTHLMDATPVTLGQEFGGYAAQIEEGIARLDDTLPRLCTLPLGGTAVGTGINAPKGFARKVVQRLAATHRASAHRGEGPLRGARCPRCARRDERPAAHPCGLAHQDRERPALDGQRTARRARRDSPARPATRFVDHAGQGQPGRSRSRHPSRRAGDRQRRHDRVRRIRKATSSSTCSCP